ncbi:HNH endonuclease [Coleofasciculus sp. G2-EDA-02]|uniref:HNH endonuclease n=1 Tax=Coleofasciculus sp. G2-EDA-02 TaxID=3069529 RepID=UPI0032FA5615
MKRELYPKNWDAIALAVKSAAEWQCQFCSRICRRPGQTWETFIQENHLEQLNAIGLVFKKQRYILTTAHLNHQPQDCRLENLAALCSGCHLRYDNRHRQRVSYALRSRSKSAIAFS